MYTEGFEDLEAQRGPRRTYVSHQSSQEETDKIFRENERLKKSLEKEKFFNKLLDQEISDLKAELSNHDTGDRSNNHRGVSRGAFGVLLFFSILMAGFIAYTLYYDKQYHLFPRAEMGAVTPDDQSQPGNSVTDQSLSASAGNSGTAVSVSGTLPDVAGTTPQSGSTAQELSGTSPSAPQSGNTATGNGNTASGNNGGQLPPATRDSVPNIIGAKSPAASGRSTQQQGASVIPSRREPAESVEYDEAAVEAELADLPPEPQQPSRPVIGRYRVTSKANFYNAADENTLRSAFIGQSGDKVVDALEDRNGFIYVEYTNDRGFTTRGWLSKKDLTKVE